MTIIVIIAAIILIGGFFYLKNEAKETAETIGSVIEKAQEELAQAKTEVEALETPKPKKKSAPRKKKETASATEGPIKGEYYKQAR